MRAAHPGPRRRGTLWEARGGVWPTARRTRTRNLDPTQGDDDAISLPQKTSLGASGWHGCAWGEIWGKGMLPRPRLLRSSHVDAASRRGRGAATPLWLHALTFFLAHSPAAPGALPQATQEPWRGRLTTAQGARRCGGPRLLWRLCASCDRCAAYIGEHHAAARGLPGGGGIPSHEQARRLRSASVGPSL